MCARSYAIFAYYTAILGAIYNMQRDEKGERPNGAKERNRRDRAIEWVSERDRGRETEEGATRLHRSRSTVCKPSSIIKFLLARVRARYTKMVLFLFRIVKSYKNSFIALELRFDFCYDETKSLRYARSN